MFQTWPAWKGHCGRHPGYRASSGAIAPDLVPQAEYDAMLLEHAGEAIPALAAAAGGDAFAPFFAGFLPLLLCKTVSALASNPVLSVHPVSSPVLCPC